MTALLVGVDIGGTKTHVRAETVDGEVRHDLVFATNGWRGADEPTKARLVMDWTSAAAPRGAAALAVGAHGCDTLEQCRKLADALEPLIDAPCVVVNDAQLLGPAAGRDRAIGVIAGTGSIAVGQTPGGDPVFAGGWGWLLGDEGGAAGLVREATRALLRSHDAGAPDEILATCLAGSAGVASADQLSMAMMQSPRGAWTSYAPAVFDAAERGSTVAADVINAGGAALAQLVATLAARGADAATVVAGGGVIVHQPRLAAAFVHAVLEKLPGTEVLVLDRPPVTGALALARAAAGSVAAHVGQ